MTITDTPRQIKKAFMSAFGVVDVGYMRKWLIVATLTGILAGVGAIVLYAAVEWATWLLLGKGAGYTPPLPGGQTIVTSIARNWMIPAICAIGGLLSGWLVYKFAPEAEGSGTDSAINAFHKKEGYIRRRIPFVKLVTSTITIGSGGSAGREGPITLIGAGFGSTIADIFKLKSSDRRIALAIGIGAGMGAIFKAPLGGALIGTEILYVRDFEFEALLPSFIASIVSYSVYASVYGWGPIFSVNTNFAFNKPEELIGYALLGIVCGVFGTVYAKTFHGVHDIFSSFKIPSYVKPAIGGLIVGSIGMFLPEILGQGYGWLQVAINGDFTILPLGIMIAVIFGKIAGTALSVGSGGSGGEFAPGLVIGGMVGGSVWSMLHNFANIVPADPAPFVMLGMMTLFGGAAKAPLAIMIMVSEMTGNYSLLIPSMLSVMIAYLLTSNNGIYKWQVNTRADSMAHRAEYSIPLLDRVHISDAMITDPVTVSPKTTISKLAEMMNAKKMDAAIVVQSRKLAGIVTTRDIARFSEDKWPQVPVQEVMHKTLLVGYPEETLHQAFNKMTEHNISHLPVVNKERPDKLIGFLAIHDIASTYDIKK